MLPSPDRVVFHLWTTGNQIPVDHPILANPQVRPMIRAIANPSTTPAQMAASLLAVAQRVRADRFGAPAFALFAQNWHNGRWGPPTNDPQYGGQDVLASPSPHTPIPSQCSMFMANAMPGAVAAGVALYNAIKSAFDGASMPYPRILAQDDESVIGFGAGNAFQQATIIGRGASAADVGVWRPSLNDARASTEIVSPGRFNGDAPLTLAAWESLRVAQGIPTTPAGFEYIENAAFRDWFNTFARYSWIVSQTAYTPALAAFGSQLITCNYNDAIGNANTRDATNPRFSAGQRRNFGKAHAPVLYSPDLADLALAGLRAFPNDDRAEYGHWMRTQREAYGVAAAGVGAGEQHKPHIPWVQLPGQTLTNAHTPSVGDVAQAVARMALVHGDSEFLLWGDDSPGNLDRALELVATVNSLTRRSSWLFA